MYQLTSLAIAALMVSARITANTNGAAVDVSDFNGNAEFVLNASAPEGAAQTLDVKVQTSEDGSTNWVDAGIAFAQVTTAGGASLQRVMASTDGLKKYARIVSTLGGSTPAITHGVTIIGKKR